MCKPRCRRTEIALQAYCILDHLLTACALVAAAYHARRALRAARGMDLGEGV